MSYSQDIKKTIERIKNRENHLSSLNSTDNKSHGYNIALLIDTSRSMHYDDKLSNARNALNRFIEQTDLKKNKIAIITFGRYVFCSELSHNNDYLKKILGQAEPEGCTPLLEAIQKAKNILDSKPNPIFIIATDGEPSTTKDGFIDFIHAKKDILEYIIVLKKQGIRFITVGIGNDIDERFLKQLATSEKDYYHSEESIHLDHIYQKIVGGLKLRE